MTFIIVSLIVFIFILGSIMFIRAVYNAPIMEFDDDEEEVIVTTTHVTTVSNDIGTSQFDVVGTLTRLKDGNQYYVHDPVDKDKVWLNSKDDMYEDAEGNIWKLI
jgi:uncharacterized protein YpmB